MTVRQPRPARRPRRWPGGVALAALGAAALGALVWSRAGSPESRWRAVQGAVSGKRWPEAEAGLTRWLTDFPADGRARLLLGEVLTAGGRDGDARASFLAVARSDPSWPRARELLGNLAFKRRDAAEAERAFRDAAEADRNAVAPRRQLAYLLVVEQRTEEAVAAVRDLYARTHGPRELASLVSIAATDPDPGDLLPAIEAFAAATPGDPRLRRARGLAELRLGRPAEALPRLESAALAVENDPVGRFALAECRLLLGRPREAVEGLGDRPERPDLRARWWVLKGQAAEALGRDDEALDCWREAGAADPNNRDARYRLGLALARRGKGEEAAPHLARAEAIRSRQSRLKSLLNGLLGGNGSAADYERLAELCLDAGFPAEARAAYEQAVGIEPTRPGLQAALAKVVAPPTAAPVVLRLRADVAAASTPTGLPGGQPTRARFEDVAARAGVTFRYDPGAKGDLFIGDMMGGGVGLFDHDGDGRLDIYLVNGCRLPYDPDAPPAPNALYRNRGDGTFQDVTARAGVGGRGYGMGCAVGDYDGDGRDDLYVTGLGSAVLYRNRGDGTFEDVTARAGVGSRRWSTAAGFADLDGDGDLDLTVVTYLDADPEHVPSCRDAHGKPIHCEPGRFTAQSDHLFRNNGDGTFTDVAREAGLDAPNGDGLGLAVADLDGDGKLDLFVANDSFPNFLFRNLGGLKFEEVGVPAGVAYNGSGRATASMGVVADDLDGDGLMDLFHTNIYNEASTLLRNLGGGHFLDTTAAAGLDAPSRAMTGFGAAALDADNDGRLDLFVANGHVDDQPWAGLPMPQRPQLFLGRAGGWFEEARGTVGPYFTRRFVGRGVAAGDLDDDGRVDLVVAHRDAPPALLRNTTEGGGHWLSVRLRAGKGGAAAVGARVGVTAGGKTSVRWQTSGTSYLGQNDPRLTFGLGPAGRVERLEVRWPSGKTESWEGLAADRGYEVREGKEPVALGGKPAR